MAAAVRHATGRRSTQSAPTGKKGESSRRGHLKNKLRIPLWPRNFGSFLKWLGIASLPFVCDRLLPICGGEIFDGEPVPA